MKYARIILSSALLVVWIICSACTGKAEHQEPIAYLSPIKNSPYTKTFDDLRLGVLADFHLNLPEADKSWITLWVEGYKNGKQTEPFRLIELEYGMHPEKISEGSVGFGMIKAASQEASMFLYSPEASVPPSPLPLILDSEKATMTTWDFSTGEDQEIRLQSGETKVLGVYREAQNSIKTYNYQDDDQLQRMINEDLTVLVLKIKVERSD